MSNNNKLNTRNKIKWQKINYMISTSILSWSKRKHTLSQNDYIKDKMSFLFKLIRCDTDKYKLHLTKT